LIFEELFGSGGLEKAKEATERTSYQAHCRTFFHSFHEFTT
jgi:hypothetical protein